MTDTITKEVTLNSNIQTVWNAITRQEEISTWFLKADFKAEKGYHYTFNSSGENCTEITGIVQKADPYTLIYTWIVEKTKAETIVSWQLEAIGEQTKLSLTHSGISNYSDEHAIKMFEDFSNGWKNCMAQLSQYLS